MSLMDLMKQQKKIRLTENYVDIYQVFSIIEKLFQEKGIINKDSVDSSKISFLYSYPSIDKELDTESRVIFDVEKRELFQKKPITSNQGYDGIIGRNTEDVSWEFENTVSLTIESKSAEKLLQILATLESIFIREYGWFAENYGMKITYKGFSTNTVPTTIVKSKTYTKRMMLGIHTTMCETKTYETIKNIDIEKE